MIRLVNNVDKTRPCIAARQAWSNPCPLHVHRRLAADCESDTVGAHLNSVILNSDNDTEPTLYR